MTGNQADADVPEDRTATGTAAELRSARQSSNRNVALALIAVALVFLAGAFGVAMLVVYAPF